MTADLRCYRALIMGKRGAVAANHPLAAQAGLLALRAGGNAIDSAVATAMTRAVVEPMMSGLGGDGFYQVYDQATRRAVVFNGSGPAPTAATPGRYASGIPRIGPLSASVPGMLAGLAAMHRSFGRLPWHELFTEAIAFARDGFGATPHYRHFAAEYRPTLVTDSRSREIFLADSAAPAVGAPIRQSDLARTLEEIGSDGAETFYRAAGAALVGRARSGGGADHEGRSRSLHGGRAGADRDRLSRIDRARGAP
jgi:gamma-glutamyltranspeptidase/glutathione hydrolase